MSVSTAASPIDVRSIPMDLIVESIHNPRRHFTPSKMAELEASIREVGVLTPLLARENDGMFELAAGHRRFRAAKSAGLPTVPVRVVELSDTQLLEVLTIENLQREDVHPMDESRGYVALMTADAAYSPKVIAAKVGKSESYVYRRLKLINLAPEVRALFERDALTPAHAERLARLDENVQVEALEEPGVLFLGLMSHESEDHSAVNIAPLSALDNFIRRRTAIDPAADDVQHYFPELTGAIEDAAAAGSTLLELSEDYMVRQKLGAGPNDPVPLSRPKWHEVTTKKDHCATTVRGVITHGGPTRVIDVCATKGCPKHFPAPVPVKSAAPGKASGAMKTAKAAPTEESWQEQQRKRNEERAKWETLRAALLVRLLAHLKKLNPQVTVDLVKKVVDAGSIQEDYGVTIDEDNIGLVLALEVVGEVHNMWDIEGFRQRVKPFKFDWRAAEKAIAAETKAAEKPAGAATKKVTKKATRK